MIETREAKMLRAKTTSESDFYTEYGIYCEIRKETLDVTAKTNTLKAFTDANLPKDEWDAVCSVVFEQARENLAANQQKFKEVYAQSLLRRVQEHYNSLAAIYKSPETENNEFDMAINSEATAKETLEVYEKDLYAVMIDGPHRTEHELGMLLQREKEEQLIQRSHLNQQERQLETQPGPQLNPTELPHNPLQSVKDEK